MWPIFVALLGLAAAEPPAAAPAAWTTHGPLGGSIYCLAADPTRASTLYAGTRNGVYRSDDGGATWRAANAGLPQARVQAIAIDPTATSTLYAGTITPDGVESVGIFKSTDGGATWLPINNGLVDPLAGFAPVDVESLAVDPRNPKTVVAGTRFSEIFKSTDGGATWQFKTLGGFSVGLETSAIQFDPSSSVKIFAATTSGLLRSTDNGETWNAYGDAGVSFFSLVADPTAASILYAGNTSGKGIFKSTDSGAHWSAINKNLPTSSGNEPPAIALAVDSSRTATLYAGTYGNGLFQSTDSGATWTAVNTGMRSSYVAAVAFGPSAAPVAGTLGGGVYTSADSGRSWSSSSSGLDLSLIYELRADPASPGTLYAAAFDGVQKTSDGGASWQPSVNGLPVAPVLALGVAPGSSPSLFAGTNGGGLLKSSDAGATWRTSASGLNDSYVSSVTVDPSSPLTVYAGTAHPYDGSNSERVYKSTDGGATWSQTSLDAKGFTVDAIAVNPAKSSQVIAVSAGVIGYFQSLDAGKTWSSIGSDTKCGSVNSVLFDSAGATILMAGGAGFCSSADGGKTWTLAPMPDNSPLTALLIDPSVPTTIYAGAAPFFTGGPGGGVFRSTDGGQTWSTLGTGLDGAYVTGLVLSAQTLHAGIYGGSVAELALVPSRATVTPPSSSPRRTRTRSPR